MSQSDPTVRTLELLVLLQARATWPAVELAERLGTSPRTLRRDLQRLAALGYEVAGKPGPGGHYRLVAGTKVPPLVFDDDEVVALVVGLRMAELGVTRHAAESALAKLLTVLPPRLSAIAAEVADHSATLDLSGGHDVSSPDELRALTEASARSRTVTFSYADQHGTATSRTVDSVHCLFVGGRWSVLGYDHLREDWRLFLLERMSDLATGGRAERHEPPAEDLADWLLTDFGRAPYTRPRRVVGDTPKTPEISRIGFRQGTPH